MVKITRSYPAPESLTMEAQKKEGSYSKPDVVARLREDFHDKCYICEMKGLQDPQIEHLPVSYTHLTLPPKLEV